MTLLNGVQAFLRGQSALPSWVGCVCVSVSFFFFSLFAFLLSSFVRSTFFAFPVWCCLLLSTQACVASRRHRRCGSIVHMFELRDCSIVNPTTPIMDSDEPKYLMEGGARGLLRIGQFLGRDQPSFVAFCTSQNYWFACGKLLQCPFTVHVLKLKDSGVCPEFFR